MTVSVAEQTTVFLCCFLCGMVIGVIFDAFRVLRKLIPTNNIVTITEDILFCILAFSALFFCALRFNYGDIRWYMIIGAGIGAVLYFFTISRVILSVCFFIIKILKIALAYIFKIVSFPVLFVFKLLKKPLIFTFNLGKTGIKRVCGKFKYNIMSFLRFYRHKSLLKNK